MSTTDLVVKTNKCQLIVMRIPFLLTARFARKNRKMYLKEATVLALVQFKHCSELTIFYV